MPKHSRGPLSGQHLISVCVAVLVGAGALTWWWTKRAPGPNADAAASSTAAEFQGIAEKLFNTPTGLFDRGRSKVLAREIEAAGGDLKKTGPLWTEMVMALLKEGHTQEAVTQADQMFEVLKTKPKFLQTQAAPHFIRGMAYLRLAEIRNCIARHNDDCCVFPLKGGGVHTEKGPAEQAMASFLDYLAVEPDNLRMRWLLNVSCMAAGTWPNGIPEKFRLPERVPGAADFPKFPDVASECGITRQNHAGGSVVDDFDGDGVLDIATSSLLPNAPLSIWHAKGDGTFEDVADQAGVKEQLGGLNMVGTDYDNDGDIDLFVLRGGWLLDEGKIRPSLLRNEGNGTFTDVTRAAGLAESAFPTQVGVWFDYDNDGDLDVFVGHESRVDPTLIKTEYSPQADYPSSLFRNDGNGKFTDVAKQAGVTNDRYCKGAAAGDYDNDGWLDLYVSNIGEKRLYHNNKDGTFTDVAPTLGVIGPVGRSFATWFFDVDNDGDLDIWVGGYDAGPDDVAAWMLGKPFNAQAPRLYRNKGDGTFEDATRLAELWRPMAPMGANFGDLDNDGWLDIYLATGSPGYDAIMPNVMLRNVGGKHFTDVTTAGGFGNLQKGHGVSFADFDCDGDQDVFNELGGLFEGDSFFNTLYENPGNANHFLTLKLQGKRTNRLGYGARIKIVVKTPAGERQIHRAVGSVSSFGGNPSRQEIGLGDATAIQSVEIWWPASGIRQNVTGLELDGFYTVVEGETAANKVVPKKLKLGAGK